MMQAGVIANKRGGKAGFYAWRTLHRIAPNKFAKPFHFEAVLRGSDGKVKTKRKLWNTVTTEGKQGIADNLLASPAKGKPTHMAVGTGTPGANALGTENDRNALTSKTRGANAIVTMIGDWAAGDATAALTEAGVFNQSSGGNMWLSTSYSVINKGANDTLQITWTLEIQ